MTIKRNSKRVEKERIDNIISKVERLINSMRDDGYEAFLLRWFTLEHNRTELIHNSTGVLMGDWDKSKTSILREVMKKENFYKFFVEFGSGDFIFTSK